MNVEASPSGKDLVRKFLDTYNTPSIVLSMLLLQVGAFVGAIRQGPIPAIVTDTILVTITFVLEVWTLFSTSKRARQWRGNRAGLLVSYFGTFMSLVLFFALQYWLLAIKDQYSFCKDIAECHLLTKIDALYFVMTTFTTTGFGDITPQSQAARLLVTGQMFVGFIMLSIMIAGVATRFFARTAS